MESQNDAGREPTSRDAAMIARAVRSRRAALGLSLAAAARLSGISAPHLSRIETGDRVPAVTLLMQLARAYDVPLGMLVGETEEGDGRGVAVRRRDVDERAESTAPSFEMLGSRSPRALLQPMRVRLASGLSGAPQTHRGEEWVHVESGILEVEVAGVTERLEGGDSIHFPAELPHRLGRAGSEPAVFLLVTAVGESGHHLGS